MIVNGIGDPLPTRHAILTGSQIDGRAFPPNEDRTGNSRTGNDDGAAQIAHRGGRGESNRHSILLPSTVCLLLRSNLRSQLSS